MLNLPKNSEIEYFLEVVQTKNFSRAAERLAITQPTLSVAIQQLELRLGTKLFTRTKKGVSLTDAGLTFQSKAQELIQMWSNLKSQTQDVSTSIKGHLRFGCHVSVGLYALSPVVPEFIREFPELEISFEHEISRKILESVVSLKIDLGLVINPIQHPDLVIKKLCDDEVTLWKAESFKLSESTALIMDSNLIQSQSIAKKLKGKFSRFVTTPSLEIARELALSGGGVAILPSRIAEAHSQGPKLKRIPGVPVFRDQLSLAYRVERKSNPAIRLLSERFAKKFSTN